MSSVPASADEHHQHKHHHHHKHHKHHDDAELPEGTNLVDADDVFGSPKPLGTADMKEDPFAGSPEQPQQKESPSKALAMAPVILLESHSSTIHHHGPTGSDIAPDKVLLDCCRESQPLNRFCPSGSSHQAYSLQRKGSLGSMLHDSLPMRGRSHSQVEFAGESSTMSNPAGDQHAEEEEHPLTLEN
mmetsp:Transcript_21415/g.24882  ORF Transcript_21415/g.24882 Transcript_21415/m.24882 type:complete len:187 (+) Transcript_21415:80-640(+)|eukprot:CAMPEP_0176421074 /NCGR_PEP_ID=MMETSP0127-20121128/8968_1 /TAXON_ID=938130 /ORGANISM="Platyophrya macrostoma, Strain WH" /LENGTH=186 /DNA_ID=CAMNT_0017801757 /DNA_START=80 /DNA_END=640 /DNA_ORIENTATION=-